MCLHPKAMSSRFWMFWPMKFGQFLRQAFDICAFLVALIWTICVNSFNLDQLTSIDCFYLYPDGIADVGQMQLLSKCCSNGCKLRQKMDSRSDCVVVIIWAQQISNGSTISKRWPTIFSLFFSHFVSAFLRATTSVSYNIRFNLFVTTMPIEPNELVNERTNEKLILRVSKEEDYHWQLKRCPIGETEAVKWEDENSDANLNNVRFELRGGNNGIGPLSPSAEEEKAG